MKGNIFGVVVIACVLGLGVAAINSGYSSAAEPGNATEQTQIDYDVNYTLQENPDPYEFTRLNVTSNGSDLREGTDYQFDTVNGTIIWEDTALTSDGENATVAYDFRDHSQTTTNQADILRLVASPLGFVFLMVSLGTLLVYTFKDPY